MYLFCWLTDISLSGFRERGLGAEQVPIIVVFDIDFDSLLIQPRVWVKCAGVAGASNLGKAARMVYIALLRHIMA